MKVPDGSCGSAIGAEQLTFIYGDVADWRHVRLGIAWKQVVSYWFQ